MQNSRMTRLSASKTSAQRTTLPAYSGDPGIYNDLSDRGIGIGFDKRWTQERIDSVGGRGYARQHRSRNEVIRSYSARR